MSYVFEDERLDVLLKRFHDTKQHISIVRVVDDTDPTVGANRNCRQNRILFAIPFFLDGDRRTRFSGLLVLSP